MSIYENTMIIEWVSIFERLTSFFYYIRVAENKQEQY